jgi:hypothetical protein
MIFILLVMIAGIVLASVVMGLRDAKTIVGLKRRIVSQYRLNDIFVSPEDKSLVGFNFDDRKIVLGSRNSLRQYDFASIVSVEVVENGTTVTQTNRGSQLVGAMVGGLALGVAGAVVGGLSGKSRSQGRIRGISLKVAVDDHMYPIYMICFLRCSSDKGLDPDSFPANQARQSVDRFHAHILTAMRPSQPKASVISDRGWVEELRKLWELKQAGILNEDEFAELKSRLVVKPEKPIVEQSRLVDTRANSENDFETKENRILQNTIYCRWCGTPTERETHFCIKCGKALG